MAARVGITRDDVVEAALAVLADDGPGGLSLAAVARRLGIRTQSLYAHVDGVEGLRRAVAVAGLARLADAVVDATVGVAAADAVAAVIRAHLRVASEASDLYDLSIHPPGDDPELGAAVAAAGAPLDRVLRRLGVDGGERVHWTRLMLSAVAGFSRLRADGRFALAVDDTATEDRLVAMLVAALPCGGRA